METRRFEKLLETLNEEFGKTRSLSSSLRSLHGWVLETLERQGLQLAAEES